MVRLADQSDLDQAEMALRRLMDVAGCDEQTVESVCEETPMPTVEEWVRLYNAIEDAKDAAWAAIERDYDACTAISGGAHLMSQMGERFSDDDRRIASRARRIDYLALCATTIILRRAAVDATG